MALVALLMADIQKHCGDLDIELILTLNVQEPLAFLESDYFYPIKVIKNQTSKGFGANHNQAFHHASGQYFCVINPDIRLESEPFSALLVYLENPAVGVVAPLVLGPAGDIENSVRRFPTPWVILSKVVGVNQKSDYSLITRDFEADWVGGMFMLFSRRVFEEVHGFDERYFLYYEDVDLCGRLRLAGYQVAVCSGSQVIHHAQRTSHRDWKFLRWHIASMLRFFLSPVYRQLNRRQQA